jgi:hypothetical protein
MALGPSDVKTYGSSGHVRAVYSALLMNDLIAA